MEVWRRSHLAGSGLAFLNFGRWEISAKVMERAQSGPELATPNGELSELSWTPSQTRSLYLDAPQATFAYKVKALAGEDFLELQENSTIVMCSWAEFCLKSNILLGIIISGADKVVPM